jgi:hypothetical protein
LTWQKFTKFEIWPHKEEPIKELEIKEEREEIKKELF